jgi:phospholipid/cholesterol/gamma-HCH transport system ATP-binding protein
MGESGVGKSTLLKTLGGVWKPRSGSLYINGESLWHPEHSFSQNKELLKKIGFCFQNNALFNSMSCLENLLFPHRKRFAEIAEKERFSLARRWLERVGLHHIDFLLPHELSGGMQKRLAIARTLMLSPEIVFFDDPTAGLDPITSRQIAATLKELLKEAPALSIVVTNDEDRARQLSDHCFLLEKGALTQRKLPT